ncbi:hypothetical protein [Maribellus mangrovi]|uniref:hypothetical protein n=1 Tax=Maribellus mangrovi TaxID=3133146 RepID=UPI0030EF23BD
MAVFFYLPLIVAVYLVYVRIRYGMTRSISASYKFLTRWQSVFPMVVLWIGISLPIMVLGLSVSDGNPFQFLWFFAGGLIAFVGAAPVVTKASLAEKVHVVGATGGIAAATAAVVLSIPSTWSFILAGVFIVFTITQTIEKLNLKMKNNTYWIEIAAMVMAWLALFIDFKQV